MDGVNQTWPTVMVAGHRKLTRDAQHWTDQELERVLIKLVAERGMATAVSGMALGVDQSWAELALLNELRLHAVKPFPGQNAKWNADQRCEWQQLLDAADEVSCVSLEDPENPRDAARMLHQRNEFMIDLSDAAVAVADTKKLTFDHKGRVQGGTWSVVEKLVKAKKPIVHVDPGTRLVRVPTPRAWADFLIDAKRRNALSGV